MTASPRAVTREAECAAGPRSAPGGGRSRTPSADGGVRHAPGRVLLGPDASRITELEREVAGPRQALCSRDVIGQAKGALFSHCGLDATSAFALRPPSQPTDTEVVDIAPALVERVRRRCPNTAQQSRAVTSALAELGARPRADSSRGSNP